jgi:mono/diheme cytochrome c family protein
MSGVIVLSGCIQEMADQPRVEAYEQSAFFDDGLGMRPQVPGTIARGQLWEETPRTTGRSAGELIQQIPADVTSELLDRGRERFGIMCAHCHGWSGYGDGMVVQRGFPAPPSYHSDRLREVPDGHLFETITNGIGRMPAFRARIEPDDRWAIVAYVRALQVSQNVAADELNAQDRSELSEVESSGR